MSLSNCKKIKINKYLLLIIVSLTVSSCFLKEENYRKQENYDKLMNAAIDFADDFNSKNNRKLDVLFDTPFKINKNKVVKKDNKAYIYYDISVPYNLREKRLKKFLDKFAELYMKKREHIVIEVRHLFIERFSKVVARYEAKRKSRGIKLDINYIDYLTREKLSKKGIKHFLLEYDQSLLAQVAKESEQKKLSLSSAVVKVANHYKVPSKRIYEIINFAKRYYSK